MICPLGLVHNIAYCTVIHSNSANIFFKLMYSMSNAITTCVLVFSMLIC